MLLCPPTWWMKGSRRTPRSPARLAFLPYCPTSMVWQTHIALGASCTLRPEDVAHEPRKESYAEGPGRLKTNGQSLLSLFFSPNREERKRGNQNTRQAPVSLEFTEYPLLRKNRGVSCSLLCVPQKDNCRIPGSELGWALLNGAMLVASTHLLYHSVWISHDTQYCQESLPGSKKGFYLQNQVTWDSQLFCLRCQGSGRESHSLLNCRSIKRFCFPPKEFRLHISSTLNLWSSTYDHAKHHRASLPVWFYTNSGTQKSSLYLNNLLLI